MVQPISDPSDPEGITRRIADLNDWLRHHITSPGQNRVMMTRGIANLIGDVSIFRNFRKRAELMRVLPRVYSSSEFANFLRCGIPMSDHSSNSLKKSNRCISKAVDSLRANNESNSRRADSFNKSCSGQACALVIADRTEFIQDD